MNEPETARLEWMLERHPDAMLVEHWSGCRTVARRDQVLVDSEETDDTDQRLLRWSREREDGAGVARYHLRPEAGVNLCELVSELRDDASGRHRTASPNHLLQAEAWVFEPGGSPKPSPRVPAPQPMPAARPVTAAVLDTGLFPHPWFQDLDWYIDQEGEAIAEVLDGDHDQRLDPTAGHGTFIAGVILQQAPATRLLIRRILGDDGVCDEFALVWSLHQLRERGESGSEPVDLVNLSLGCHTFDDRPTPVMERAIGALGAGTVVVASAGNTGTERPFWPAALDSVVSVGALDSVGEHRANFSNHGPWVDACATGENVHSSFVVFDGPAAASGADPDRFNGYATWSGTSFAAPAVAGVIAARSAAQGVSAAESAAAVLDPARTRSLDGMGAVVSV